MLQPFAVDEPFAEDRVPLVRELLGIRGGLRFPCHPPQLPLVAICRQPQPPTPRVVLRGDFEAAAIENGGPVLQEIPRPPSTMHRVCRLAMALEAEFPSKPDQKKIKKCCGKARLACTRRSGFCDRQGSNKLEISTE